MVYWSFYLTLHLVNTVLILVGATLGEVCLLTHTRDVLKVGQKACRTHRHA